jgi:hypothetical protein
MVNISENLKAINNRINEAKDRRKAVNIFRIELIPSIFECLHICIDRSLKITTFN